MRDIGDQVLRTLGDSSTRIMPVAKNGNAYVIAFERPVALEYDRLVPVVSQKMHSAGIHRFITELKDCQTDEVILAFAYEGPTDAVTPCQGREGPVGCYRIEITPQMRRLDYLGLPFALIGVSLATMAYFLLRRKEEEPADAHQDPINRGTLIGRFIFIPEERTLLFDGLSSSLTDKETKLLLLLSEHPDQTLSRETLMAGIWGGEGIQVIPRNIDVLVSKLRKKLASDPGVQIENVHGVGYKLVKQ